MKAKITIKDGDGIIRYYPQNQYKIFCVGNLQSENDFGDKNGRVYSFYLTPADDGRCPLSSPAPQFFPDTSRSHARTAV